jgi:hypothetical protein
MQSNGLPPGLRWHSQIVAGSVTTLFLFVASGTEVARVREGVPHEWSIVINRDLTSQRDVYAFAPSLHAAMHWAERWAMENLPLKFLADLVPHSQRSV